MRETTCSTTTYKPGSPAGYPLAAVSHTSRAPYSLYSIYLFSTQYSLPDIFPTSPPAHSYIYLAACLQCVAVTLTGFAVIAPYLTANPTTSRTTRDTEWTRTWYVSLHPFSLSVIQLAVMILCSHSNVT